MNLSKKFILGCIIVVLSAWGFNIVRHEIYSLKEPFFIQDYVEKEVLVIDKDGDNLYDGPSYVEFYYVDNASNMSYLSNGIDYSTIVFPEINSTETPAVNNGVSGSTFDMFNQQNNYIEGVEFYPYRLNVLRVDLKSVILKDGSTFYDKLKTEKQVNISKIQVGYGDNSREIDIGNVQVTAVNQVTTRNALTEQRLSESDSTGWNKVGYKALKDIQIQGADSEFYKELSSVVEIKINDVVLDNINYPIKVKKGEEFIISYKFHFKTKGKDIEPKLIETWLNLKIVDSDMKEEDTKVFICNWYHSIADILKESGNLNKVFHE